MWVVKLGGSLQYSDQLPLWLAEMAEHGDGKIVIVPGGGAFADQVRRAQQHWHFGDAAAHRMALLAMEQYGLMLHDMEPRLCITRSGDEIVSTLQKGKAAIWLPASMILQCKEIPVGWDISADSIAAWLTISLQAQRLLLVKSFKLAPGLHPIPGLIRHGLLDLAFAEMVEGHGFEVNWLYRDQYSGLKALFHQENKFTVRLVQEDHLASA